MMSEVIHGFLLDFQTLPRAPMFNPQRDLGDFARPIIQIESLSEPVEFTQTTRVIRALFFFIPGLDCVASPELGVCCQKSPVSFMLYISSF